MNRIQAITRHADDFDILTRDIDLAQSPYARTPTYIERVTRFYRELGIESALWLVAAEAAPAEIPVRKPTEYLLEIDVDRVVAYVDELTWVPYKDGKSDSFNYSRIPTQYDVTSMLIEAPLSESEVLEVRRYQFFGGPDTARCVERRPWRAGIATDVTATRQPAFAVTCYQPRAGR